MPTHEDGSGPAAGGAGAVVALDPGGAQRPLTEIPGQGAPRWRILSAFVHSRQAVVGVGLVVLIALFCFAGPLIYRTNQVTVNLSLATLRPSAGHPLGTDGSGYDVLGRLMLGGQSSLELGLAVAIATTVIGTFWGAIAGLAGRLRRLGHDAPGRHVPGHPQPGAAADPGEPRSRRTCW